MSRSKKKVRSEWENIESPFPQVQSFLRSTGGKRKEKAVVNQTFVGISQNVISKLKNGSWQNSWWIGLMSEERNKPQHMSKPAVLGPSMIIPQRIGWVQLERATVPCFSIPQGHCWEAHGRSEWNSTAPEELTLCLGRRSFNCTSELGTLTLGACFAVKQTKWQINTESNRLH